MFGLHRKKRRQLHFALVVADRPTDGFKFTPDKDCDLFMVTGEIDKREVIPKITLKAIVDRFENKEEKKAGDGEVRIIEKQV